MTKKIGLLLVFVLAVSLIFSSNAFMAKKLTKIVVVDTPTTHHLNLYVAKEKGIFAKYGLDVEIKESRSPAAARDAVISKEADVFWACPTVVLAAAASGAPLKIIAQVKKPCTSILAVRTNSPIKEFKDLDGKTIAGLSPTCCAVIYFNQKVKEVGAAFKLVNFAAGPALAALDAGQVDGAILEEPHASIAELKGYKLLFREELKNTTCRTINANSDFLAKNTKALKNLIKAVDAANKLILKNPVADDLVAIAVKYSGAPEDAIRNGNHRLGFTIKLTTDIHASLGEALVSQGVITKNPVPDVFAKEFKGITW